MLAYATEASCQIVHVVVVVDGVCVLSCFFFEALQCSLLCHARYSSQLLEVNDVVSRLNILHDLLDVLEREQAVASMLCLLRDHIFDLLLRVAHTLSWHLVNSAIIVVSQHFKLICFLINYN